MKIFFSCSSISQSFQLLKKTFFRSQNNKVIDMKKVKKYIYSSYNGYDPVSLFEYNQKSVLCFYSSDFFNGFLFPHVNIKWDPTCFMILRLQWINTIFCLIYIFALCVGGEMDLSFWNYNIQRQITVKDQHRHVVKLQLCVKRDQKGTKAI